MDGLAVGACVGGGPLLGLVVGCRVGTREGRDDG